jgi:hypothetical protein
MTKRRRDVTREEFQEYLKTYPNKLDFSCLTICEPPLGCYYDFTTGKEGFDARVAAYCMEWLGPNGEMEEYERQYWTYFIEEDDGIAEEKHIPVLTVKMPDPLVSYTFQLKDAK